MATGTRTGGRAWHRTQRPLSSPGGRHDDEHGPAHAGGELPDSGLRGAVITHRDRTGTVTFCELQLQSGAARRAV